MACPVTVVNMQSARVVMVKHGLWMMMVVGSVVASVEIWDGVVVLMDSETVKCVVAGTRIHSGCRISAVE
jgi:hypothetical protein